MKVRIKKIVLDTAMIAAITNVAIDERYGTVSFDVLMHGAQHPMQMYNSFPDSLGKRNTPQRTKARKAMLNACADLTYIQSKLVNVWARKATDKDKAGVIEIKPPNYLIIIATKQHMKEVDALLKKHDAQQDREQKEKEKAKQKKQHKNVVKNTATIPMKQAGSTYNKKKRVVKSADDISHLQRIRISRN